MISKHHHQKVMWIPVILGDQAVQSDPPPMGFDDNIIKEKLFVCLLSWGFKSFVLLYFCEAVIFMFVVCVLCGFCMFL